ncbi:serine-pyruvate aminotransferase [soil metagenome]
MRKPRLMTPGPAPVPEDVMLEMARPVIHSRDPRTKDAIKLAAEGLKEVFRTQNDVIIMAATGTGAMEAATINAVPPGGKALVLNAGWFGLRWAKICKAHKIEAVTIDFDWGQPVDPQAVANALKQHPDVSCVMGTLSETSTGTGHPIEAIGKIVAETDALFAVDGISGVGAMECHTDAWNIDLLAVGSQKALMLPPGLAFLTVSPKAWARVESFDPSAFYFSLSAARKKLPEFDTPYTPAHTLIFGLVKSLDHIRAEGIENVWTRHKRMSDACQAGVKALGIDLFSARPAEGLTAFVVPEGLKDSDIRKKLDERFGITVVGGQDKLKGKIIRIGHMGYNDELDVIGALAALEMVLADLGHDFEPGAAVAAAQRVLIGQGSVVASI